MLKNQNKPELQFDLAKEESILYRLQTFVRVQAERISTKNLITNGFILSFHPHKRTGFLPLSEWQAPQYFGAFLFIFIILVTIVFIYQISRNDDDYYWNRKLTKKDLID